MPTKKMINEELVEQISHFYFLECDISYKEGKDITNNIHKHQMMCGTVQRIKNQVREKTNFFFK